MVARCGAAGSLQATPPRDEGDMRVEGIGGGAAMRGKVAELILQWDTLSENVLADESFLRGGVGSVDVNY